MVLRVGPTLGGARPSSRDPYLDERESGSRLQGLVFMFHLIGHILLHPLFLIDLPLVHHVEERA